MKLIQKSSIIRIFKDLIGSNTVINSHKIDIYNKLLSSYGFDFEDELRAEKLSLERACATCKELENIDKQKLLTQIKEITNVQAHNTQKETLIRVAIELAIDSNSANNTYIISTKTTKEDISDDQVLYIENSLNEAINQDIEQNYSHISKELKYVGLHLLYLPHIIKNYSSLEGRDFDRIINFIHPSSQSQQIESIKNNFLNITSARFTNEVIISRLNIKPEDINSPSLIIKIGTTHREDEDYTNFLIIKITEAITKHIYSLSEGFGSSHNPSAMEQSYSIKDNLVLKGYYKMLFEPNLATVQQKSSILIDTLKGEIIFSEINEKLQGVNRREKALYVLFLLESSSGGIEFNLSENLKQMKDKAAKNKKLQNKYNSIYKIFGGEVSKAPDISIAEIRLPMISRIKKSINKLASKLSDHERYIIKRSPSGTYNLTIDTNMIYCRDIKNAKGVLISQSEAFKKVKPL
ncbi:MAG: hypothetical protein R3Y38_07645 [Rikenellaceae bacterium]